MLNFQFTLLSHRSSIDDRFEFETETAPARNGVIDVWFARLLQLQLQPQLRVQFEHNKQSRQNANLGQILVRA